MTTWRLLALYISVVCGFVFVSAAVTSDGWDLRPSGGDVSTILEDRTRSAQARQTKVAGLESEIEKLGAKSNSGTLNAENKRIKKYRAAAGMTELVGPGIRVALDDAPRSVDVPGLDPNLLVVHQQDIQAVVNALWQGGAEAITLQGQRINSTTGIKCVGNTVVLNGVPYSPPYVIEAVGSQYGMSTALENSPEVSIFRDYATRYGLGYSSDVKREIVIPAYEGVIAMSHANVIE
ncbi:MAG: DUF881 domain-containing protein [Actinomycetales bacterium]|nr:DUF881 domain-containing protein [Actinomycetales bacterium]